MPVEVAELVHIRSTTTWKRVPPEIAPGVPNHGVVELGPLLPLWVTFLPFISFGKKHPRDHQLSSSTLSYKYFDLYSVESVVKVNHKTPFFSPLCSTQVPKDIEPMRGSEQRSRQWWQREQKLNAFIHIGKILKCVGSSHKYYLLFSCSSEVCKSSSFFFRYSSFSCSASSPMDFLIHAFNSSIPSPVCVDIGIISLNSSVFAGIISSSSKCK